MLTVAIPNHNYSHLINYTIDSVLNQSYDNFEILVYDDASTDYSVALLKDNYGDKVKVIEGKENRGAGFARNTIIDQANGEFILFLDSDDILSVNALEKLIMTASQGYDVVYGKADSFSDSNCGYKRHLYVNEMVDKLKNNQSVYTMAQIICPWNKLISTSFIRKHNIKFSEKRVMEDVLFAHLLAFAEPRTGFIDDVIVKIRHHPGSLSCFADKQKLRIVVEVTNEVIEISKKNSLYSKLKLNGNNLVYFLFNNSLSPQVFQGILEHKSILPIGYRVLIAMKLLKITRSIQYLKLI